MANNALLKPTRGVMAFASGALGLGFADPKSLHGDTLVNLSSDELSFNLTRFTVLFRGTVFNPLTGRLLPNGGVLFQKRDTALGQVVACQQTRVFKLGATDWVTATSTLPSAWQKRL